MEARFVFPEFLKQGNLRALKASRVSKKALCKVDLYYLKINIIAGCFLMVLTDYDYIRGSKVDQ